MNRAERRHRRAVKVAKAQRMLKRWGMEKVASWWADNMAKCSCHMCRGPDYNRHEHKLVWDGELDDE